MQLAMVPRLSTAPQGYLCHKNKHVTRFCNASGVFHRKRRGGTVHPCTCLGRTLDGVPFNTTLNYETRNEYLRTV